MQKITEKLENIPTDASLVCSSVSLSLNREDTIRVMDKVRSVINPEVNQAQHTERSLKPLVYALLVLSPELKTQGFPCRFFINVLMEILSKITP